MSQKSAILQKKVSELESELAEAFRLPPHSDSGHKILRRVQKRLVYITSLLSAEAASTPEKSDDQLDEIREKLAGLEAAFHCMSEYRTYALHSFLDEAPASVCSRCIQTYLDADDEADAPDSPYRTAEHCDGEKKGRTWGRFGKLCGAFGTGLIVGAVACCIAINFSSLFLDYSDIYFIPPT
ncbi:hypothetical protein C2S52_016069 [Perilla frutescens var. hirtella]|nr:hypothetical protein C2S52_016069 [Perilla frutescens var. hirtella]